MPTENRSNTEMVSVPREPTREMLVAAQNVNGILPIWRAMVAAAPAEQHQGEPVVPKLKKPRYTPTPCRFGGKDGYYQVGGVLVYDSLAEAQASADRKNAELAQRYYEALEHADPGEVERLRAEIKSLRQHKTDYMNAAEETRKALLAQLAERDALLRDSSGKLIRMAAHLVSAPLFALLELQDEDKRMTRARVDDAVDSADSRLKDAAYELRRIADALSASAEPSAPKYPRVEIVRAHKHTCACCKEGAEHGPCDCGAVVDGVAVPASAPVEHDELAAFEAWANQRTWFNPQAGAKERDDCTFEYADEITDHNWISWQARAALERKP